jgi:hypothetical protein
MLHMSAREDMHNQLVIRELEQHSCSVVRARTHCCKYSILPQEVCCQRGSLGLAAFLLMMLVPPLTGAQTLDEAVSGALDRSCAALFVCEVHSGVELFCFSPRRPNQPLFNRPFNALINRGFGPNLAEVCWDTFGSLIGTS